MRPLYHQHTLKQKCYVILMKFLPLATPKVVILTTSSAAIDKNIIKSKNFHFSVMFCWIIILPFGWGFCQLFFNSLAPGRS